jgi:predicted methyltransferase
MRTAVFIALVLGACNDVPHAAAPVTKDSETPGLARFPAPDRPVAGIVSDRWSDEDSRDNAGEAEEVVRLLGISPGIAIADIGAGSGYYTVRLSPRVGPEGTIYANDIIPDYLGRLKNRVSAEGLANVKTILGDPGNARLPAGSTDIALMVHMYHEIEDPFGLLWHLHESLKPGGRVAIIDADRPTARHGTPPTLLKCELEAAGYTQVAFHPLQGNYLAVFEPVGRPEPETIRPCRAE